MSRTLASQSFELEVGAPSRRLRGRVVGAAPESRPSHPVVVLVHGYLASMDWGFFPAIARVLVERGIATVAFDLTGGGVSGARPGELDDELGFSRNTYAQELEDLAAITEFVRSGAVLGVDPRRAGILGHSRGAAMALVHAAESGAYRALCSWSGGSRVARYEPHRLEEWQRDGSLRVPLGDGRTWRLERDLYRDFERNRTRYDLVRAGARFAGAWRFVHGERDRAVPEAEVRAFVEQLERAGRERPELAVVPAAGHNFGGAGRVERVGRPLREALDATASFFERELVAKER
ncbi:MAG: prolyl oligopeptidase family serine peptidase [Planctomycetota bacterium]